MSEELRQALRWRLWDVAWNAANEPSKGYLPGRLAGFMLAMIHFPEVRYPGEHWRL